LPTFQPIYHCTCYLSTYQTPCSRYRGTPYSSINYYISVTSLSSNITRACPHNKVIRSNVFLVWKIIDVQIEDYEEIVGSLDYSTPTASRSASPIPGRDLSSFQEPTIRYHMAARLTPVNEHVASLEKPNAELASNGHKLLQTLSRTEKTSASTWCGDRTILTLYCIIKTKLFVSLYIYVDLLFVPQIIFHSHQQWSKKEAVRKEQT